MKRYKIDVLHVHGVIDYNTVDARTFDKGCTVVLFRRNWLGWEELESFHTVEEARAALKLIRDLPEYF